MARTRLRVLYALLATVALVALSIAPASAHVSVNPDQAAGGGFATLSFRVPNERETATTTKVEVNFPESQPLTSVSVKPVPGWTYQIQRAKLDQPIDNHGTQVTEVVRSIAWTADSASTAIKANEFQDFPVSVGRLPESGQMVFKALQTYDNGEVVRWIEETAEGAAEPEHPAPVLSLTAAENTGADSSETQEQQDSSDMATWALVVAVVALLLGAGGLTVGLMSRRR